MNKISEALIYAGDLLYLYQADDGVFFLIIELEGLISIVCMALRAGFCILIMGIAERREQNVLQPSTPLRLGHRRDEKKLQTSS